MTSDNHDHSSDDLCVETLDLTVEQPPAPRVPAEVQRLRDRLAEVLRELWRVQARSVPDNHVRLVGRVIKLDTKSKEAVYKTLWMALEDEDGNWYPFRLVGASTILTEVSEGMHVELLASWVRSRLTVIEVEEAREVAEAIPEVKLPDATAKAGVPDWFDSQAQNKTRDLLKASDGSSSVSDLKIHLVWACKRRGRLLTAAMIERIKDLTAQVVDEKHLGRLLAVNGEADHIHVALWLPVNIAPSEAMGLIKSYTSRFLRREFPELKDHDDDALWQRGGFVGSIGNGGDMSAVINYIANQDAMGE